MRSAWTCLAITALPCDNDNDFIYLTAPSGEWKKYSWKVQTKITTMITKEKIFTSEQQTIEGKI